MRKYRFSFDMPASAWMDLVLPILERGGYPITHYGNRNPCWEDDPNGSKDDLIYKATMKGGLDEQTLQELNDIPPLTVERITSSRGKRRVLVN